MTPTWLSVMLAAYNCCVFAVIITTDVFIICESNIDTYLLSQGASTSASTQNPPSLNFPLPGETGPVALVKVYDDLGETLKLNDMIEVYGVISTDPALSQIGHDE